MPLPRAGSLMMELRKVNLERYKGYAEPTEIEIAPLTILVGANDSGKTALAQAIQLLAGGLAPSEQDMAEPLPLESGGIRHGLTFRDLAESILRKRPVPWPKSAGLPTVREPGSVSSIWMHRLGRFPSDSMDAVPGCAHSCSI